MDLDELDQFSENKLKQEKLKKLRKSVLTALAENIGQKYNITLVNETRKNAMFYWLPFEDDRVKLKVDNDLCDKFILASFRFLNEPQLLDFVMRTLTSSDCSADDYLRLAEMFILKRDIQVKNDYTIDKLLALVEKKGSKMYKVANFCYKYRDFCDWELIYNKYQELLDEGFSPSDFYLMSNNMKRAIACFSRVNQGDREAMWQFVRFAQSPYRKGMIDMLKRLALLGDQQAMRELSDSLFSKHKSLKSQRDDIQWHELAAQSGYDNAILRTGRLYLGSNGDNPLDLDKAIHFLKLAAEKNNVEAMVLLARIYRNSEKNSFNLQEASHWLLLAAVNGSKEAQQMLHPR